MGYSIGQAVNQAKQAGTGAAVGGAVAGPQGGILGGIAGAGSKDISNKWENNLGLKNDKANDLAKKQQANLQAQYGANKGVVGQMKQSDDDYQQKMGSAADDYQLGSANKTSTYIGQSKLLEQQAQDQQKNAQSVYSNTIQPEMKNIMETAKTNAGQAMSLKDAGDPNNSVQTAVRGMYNDQAAGVGRQGLADSGVLSALGAKAMAGQMGNMGPMTGGQMQALAGANMSQAGQAYARAQQRMNDLRQQGIDQGFVQSDAQYKRGQDATDRYSNSVKDIASADHNYNADQAGFRGEIGGYQGNQYNAGMTQQGINYNMQSGKAALGHDLATNQGNMQIGLNNDLYGGQQGVLSNMIAQSGAQQAGKMGMLSSAISGGAQIAGSAVGSKPAAPSGGGGTAAAATPSGYDDQSTGYNGRRYSGYA